MIIGPVILGSRPDLLTKIRAIFHMARLEGEFDPLRTEPSGAEWIIWEGGDVVEGFALLSFAGPGLVALEPIWVAPRLRRQGLGRRLVKAATESGLGQILIGLTNDNEAMLSLCGALGFQPSGVIMSKTVGD